MGKVVVSIFSVIGDCEAWSEISAENMANDIFDKMDVDIDGICLRGRMYQVLSEKNAIFNMLTN